MSNVEDFLSPREEEEIIEAIRKAELKTSGEIRVHIECHHEKKAYARSQQIFRFLKMDNTRLQNGVLIYIAVDDHEFAIYGDKGIHEKVKFKFWETSKTVMESHFKKGYYKVGIIKCVEQIGEQLEHFFPWSPYDDNELSNEISKG